MAAMVAPHVDSVQTSTPTAWRAARGRSARGFGQKPTEFEMHFAERAGAPGGGPATLPPPPAPALHSLTAPAKPRARRTAHAVAHAAATQKL